MTSAVDWALKANFLSIYLSFLEMYQTEVKLTKNTHVENLAQHEECMKSQNSSRTHHYDAP